MRSLRRDNTVTSLMDESAEFDSHISVADTDFANVSDISDSSGDQQLNVKDIVNWRECTDIWIALHPVVQADLSELSQQHPCASAVYAIVRYMYDIPRSRFDVPSTPGDSLENHLNQLAYAFPQLFSNDLTQFWDGYTNGAELLKTAHDLQQMALNMLQQGASDETWDMYIYDQLITQCARGRTLLDAESIVGTFSAPTLNMDGTTSSILNTRKIRPRGVIPMPSNSESFSSFYIASISTRSQVASPLRELPEATALHTFSLFATDAILASGMHGPVFGIMCDKQFVRMHVDWAEQMDQHHNHVSALVKDITGSSNLPPFRELDLTRMDDALRIVFVLDAMRVEAKRLGKTYSVPKSIVGDQAQPSSVEKVSEWMKRSTDIDQN